MIAALPMYDLPEIADATDALWAALRDRLRRRGVAAPDTLTRSGDPYDIWRSPDLLFAQTCGRPYAATLRAVVRLVATPSYAAEGCRGPSYRSVVVVRTGDPARTLGDVAGRRLAFNGIDSLSGFAMPRAAVAHAGASPDAFFPDWLETGGHRASCRAVAAGEADCAAIDCVTWALLARHASSEVAGLRVLATTPEAPALPYITAGGTDDATLSALRDALGETLADPATAAVRDTLLLEGLAVLPDAAYDRATELARLGACDAAVP